MLTICHCSHCESYHSRWIIDFICVFYTTDWQKHGLFKPVKDIICLRVIFQWEFTVEIATHNCWYLLLPSHYYTHGFAVSLRFSQQQGYQCNHVHVGFSNIGYQIGNTYTAGYFLGVNFSQIATAGTNFTINHCSVKSSKRKPLAKISRFLKKKIPLYSIPTLVWYLYNKILFINAGDCCNSAFCNHDLCIDTSAAHIFHTCALGVPFREENFANIIGTRL